MADLAISTSQAADYTMVLLAGVTSNHDLAVLDLLRDRLDGPNHLMLLRYVCQRWQFGIIGIE